MLIDAAQRPMCPYLLVRGRVIGVGREQQRAAAVAVAGQRRDSSQIAGTDGDRGVHVFAVAAHICVLFRTSAQKWKGRG